MWVARFNVLLLVMCRDFAVGQNGQARPVRIRGPVRIIEKPDNNNTTDIPLPALVMEKTRLVPGTAAFFGCWGRAPGFYADVPSGCRAFHICAPDGQHSLHVCGTGTVFNQLALVCDHVYNYDCAMAVHHYDVNRAVRPFDSPATSGSEALP